MAIDNRRYNAELLLCAGMPVVPRSYEKRFAQLAAEARGGTGERRPIPCRDFPTAAGKRMGCGGEAQLAAEARGEMCERPGARRGRCFLQSFPIVAMGKYPRSGG